MGFVGLLRFSLKHLVLLAWPFCALGYPLCTSIRAIESKSEAETLNLIAYWISFSAILLFEHAFNKLLEWLGIWCYLKLVIVLCLVTNDFVASAYVYNHVFKPCLSLNLQTFIDWFNEAKSSFSNKDRFLTELEKYVNDNGTDVLQNLLVAKGVNLGLATKEVKVVTEVERAEASANSVDMFYSEISHDDSPIAESGLSSSKYEGLKVACKDFSAVHITENKQLTRVKKDELKPPEAEKSESSPPDVKEVLSISNAVSEIPKKILPQSVQKQWTCAICQVVTTSQGDLKSHLRGRRHKAACEELKVNNITLKPAQVSSPIKKKSSVPRTPDVMQKQRKHESLKNDGGKAKDSLWRCAICNISCTGKVNLDDHLNGKKHLAVVQNSSGY